MKKVMSLFLICLVADMVHGQSRLTLANIRDSIERNHPAIKMADASARAMDAEADGAFAWMPPEAGAGFFQAPYNVGKWKGTSDMPGMGMFMISAEQMFPNKKAQQAEYDFMKSRGAVELEKKSGIVNTLLTQARNAYYKLIILKEKSTLLDQNQKLVEFMIQSAEIRYRNNLGNINSYYKLKAALAKMKTSQKVLDADQQQQRTIINNLLLRDETTAFQIDTAFYWYSFTSATGGNEPLKNTSEFRMLGKSILVNQMEAQSQQAALKPQFGVKFEHMIGFGHQPQMFSLMAMVKLPMAKWSAKMNRAKMESLVYENESLEAQQRTYLNKAKGEAQSMLIELDGIKAEMKMYEGEVIPALLKNFQTLQISYEQNKAEIFELFDSWQSLLDMQMEYLDARERAMELQSNLMNIFEILS